MQLTFMLKNTYTIQYVYSYFIVYNILMYQT